jgi:hypothetical protein
MQVEKVATVMLDNGNSLHNIPLVIEVKGNWAGGGS